MMSADLFEWRDPSVDERVEEWRQCVLYYKKPLVTIMQPLPVFMKAKFCDADAPGVSEKLIELHSRPMEGAEFLLKWLIEEQDKTSEDQLARWQLFGGALKAVYPHLYEIISDKNDPETQQYQKRLLDFFMDEIAHSVDPAHLLPSLYSHDLLSQLEGERLRCVNEQQGPTMGAVFMLCNIHRNRRDWFQTFLRVLVENEYEELVKLIDEKVYDKIKKTPESGDMIGVAEEENILQAHGAAYVARPDNYAGAPQLAEDKGKSLEDTERERRGEGMPQTEDIAQREDMNEDIASREKELIQEVMSLGVDTTQRRDIARNDSTERKDTALDYRPTTLRKDIAQQDTQNNSIAQDDSTQRKDIAQLDSAQRNGFAHVNKMQEENDSKRDNMLQRDDSFQKWDIEHRENIAEKVNSGMTHIENTAQKEGATQSQDVSHRENIVHTEDTQKGNTSCDETDPKSLYHRDPEHAESDNEDNESFHSCNDLDLGDVNDPDLTLMMSPMTSPDQIKNISGENRREMRNDEFSNRESMASASKTLRGKNINLTSEENAVSLDNSNVEWENPDHRHEAEDVHPESLDLRPYQQELAEQGLKGKNVIIVAPTGSGKTHVAIRLIQNHLGQRGVGVRKVVFLVNQVALAQQQYEACKKYLCDWRVRLVTGNPGATSTEKVPLKHLVMNGDILIMTAQVLVNALDQREVSGICQFSMLVLDECHHTNLQHPFNSIMHYYMHVKYSQEDENLVHEQLPQVVGLTASVGVGKAGNQDKAREHILKLCAHLDTQCICTVTRHTEQLARFSNEPKYDQKLCGKRPDDKFQVKIEDIMKTIEEKMEKSEYLTHEDTDVLKEKLKLKPHVRGTSQYTGWVSELMKTIHMLEDAEARRFMDSARCMLKFYNEALVINDECDTEDALDFLSQQLNDKYDPLNRRTTEMDRFLKDIFDKHLPYLQALSKEQANTNPKLISLESLIVKAFEEVPESRAIVFVKTRDLATALLKWSHRRAPLKALKPGRIVGAGPSTDKGGMTKNQQWDVMEYFKAGDHKVMIATSVAEEGLDIQKCNLVIRYNHVTNEIAMVQARGRARAENSQFMTLASKDKGVQEKEEVNIIREMMMHQAIRQLQSEIRIDCEKFRRDVEHIQKEEKSKRDAEMSARQGRQLRQGEMVFRCRYCDSYAFISSDVRKIESSHHIIMDLDYRNRNIERVYPPKEYGSIQVRGRVYCKECGADWGPVLTFQQVKFTGINLEGFRLTDERGRKDIPKKWKQVNFVVSNLQSEELEQYRKDAIAVGYINLGD